jgi:hypothetical protein
MSVYVGAEPKRMDSGKVKPVANTPTSQGKHFFNKPELKPAVTRVE